VTATVRAQLARDVDAAEGAYDFFLAYAAQGLGREAGGSRVEAQLREHLEAMREAVGRLATGLRQLLAEEDGLAGGPELAAFADVLAADAARAAVALALVAAQPVATSQLVDNLNASLHVRTLLTDLFLLDEALGLEVGAAEVARVGAAGNPGAG
jgi:hypothetical protein